MLEKEVRKYAGFLNHMPSMYFILDSNGTVLFVNDFASSLLGYDKQELIGQSVQLVIHPHDQELFRAQFDKLQYADAVMRWELRKQMKNGDILWVQENAWQLEMENESVTFLICNDVTDQKRTEALLERQKQVLESFINNTADAIVVYDIKGNVIRVNRAYEEIFGWREEEVVGYRLPNIPDFMLAEAEGFYQTVRSGGQVIAVETIRRRKDGSLFDVSITISPIRDEAGQVVGMSGIARDISQRKQAERKLDESKQHYKSLFEYNPNGICSLDLKGNLLRVNPTMETITGYTSSELLRSSLLASVIPSDMAKVKDHFCHTVLGESQTFETTIIHKDGFRVNLSVITTPIVINREITGVYVIMEDITEHKRAEETIHYMAFYDIMTGLPNRSLLQKRFAEIVQSEQQARQSMAVLFVDLDRFKTINDTLGHNAGDMLLKHVAERLSKCVRGQDMIARFGGDEFVILLPGIEKAIAAAAVANRIRDELHPPFFLDGQEFYLSVSIGISLYPHDGQTLDVLVKHADLAMYSAKEEGSRYRFYSSDMNAGNSDRLIIERDLHRALEREEFLVCYQPKMDLANWKIIGMEALIRWQHPEFGMVPPNEFIPLAEDNGLIIPIGEWIMRAACLQNKKWQEAGYPPVRVSVNLSARQFQQKNLVSMIQNVLSETGLDANWLEIEITESSLLRDIETTIEKLDELKRMGIQISIDDFGKGYSSLSYLKRFPVDILKIDQSFVRDLTEDSVNAAIVKAVITLGHNLNLKVIAEGVEHEEQAHFLKQQQCDGIQGYLLSRPLPPLEIVKIFDFNQ